jgi:hypothetical protein
MEVDRPSRVVSTRGPACFQSVVAPEYVAANSRLGGELTTSRSICLPSGRPAGWFLTGFLSVSYHRPAGLRLAGRHCRHASPYGACLLSRESRYRDVPSALLSRHCRPWGNRGCVLQH